MPDASDIARFVLAREGRREASRRERVSRARSVASRLARRLVEEYGARQVLLFGSVASGRGSDDPDIDLAVEGLEPGRLVEALGEFQGAEGFAVDLVGLERAPVPLRDRILADGVRLP